MRKKKVVEEIYYTSFDTQLGRMHVASTAQGVCRVRLPAEDEEGFFRWLSGKFGAEGLVEVGEKNGSFIEEAISELRRYLEGALREFRCPVDLRGTPFQQEVWHEIKGISYGMTASYGDVARAVGRPKAFRAVGRAVGANPVPIIIPCHRVVGHDGSLRGYGGGLALKEALLRLEGAILV